MIHLPTLPDEPLGSTLPVPWGQPVTLDFIGGDTDDDTLAPFTLEVTRPARPDGRVGVKYQWSFDQPAEDDTPDLFFVFLTPGQPVEVVLNSNPLFRREGGGWGNCRRSTVTLRAMASPKMLSQIGILTEVRHPAKEGLLFVPVAAHQAFEIQHDGRLLVSEPKREGGLH